MSKNKMPTDAELEKKYGRWVKNEALQAAANWTLPNKEKEFKEDENLDYFDELKPSLNAASKELFES